VISILEIINFDAEHSRRIRIQISLGCCLYSSNDGCLHIGLSPGRTGFDSWNGEFYFWAQWKRSSATFLDRTSAINFGSADMHLRSFLKSCGLQEKKNSNCGAIYLNIHNCGYGAAKWATARYFYGSILLRASNIK
jgi:hypothetical protein